MSATRIHIGIATCAIALALFAPSAATASTTHHPDAVARALAQERYYTSFAKDEGRTAAALAQQQYYSSYGRPQPLAAPQQSPAPSHDDVPWQPIALWSAVALAIVVTGVTGARRLRIRRRAPRVAA
jgi:hypothetical protein